MGKSSFNSWSTCYVVNRCFCSWGNYKLNLPLSILLFQKVLPLLNHIYPASKTGFQKIVSQNNANSYHWLRTSYVPVSILSSLCMLYNLIFITVPWSSYYLSFTDKESGLEEVQTMYVVCEVLELVSEEVNVWNTCCPALHCTVSCGNNGGYICWAAAWWWWSTKNFTAYFPLLPTTILGILFQSTDAETELKSS